MPSTPSPTHGALTLTTLTTHEHADDSQRLHARITALHEFELPADGAPRTLWANPAPGRILIQSATPPAPCDWATTTGSCDYSGRLTTLPVGSSVRYALIANPIRCVPPRDEAGRSTGRGQRTPLPLDEREAWLRRKLAPALHVVTYQGRPLPTAAGQRTGGRTVHARHLFTGTGTVTDPDALRALVIAGVGPGKAYGCGLLLITPQERP